MAPEFEIADAESFPVVRRHVQQRQRIVDRNCRFWFCLFEAASEDYRSHPHAIAGGAGRARGSQSRRDGNREAAGTNQEVSSLHAPPKHWTRSTVPPAAMRELT
jgi:hypothetical protein